MVFLSIDGQFRRQILAAEVGFGDKGVRQGMCAALVKVLMPLAVDSNGFT